MPAPSPPVTITVFVPGQLMSRLNGSGSRAHWSSIAREAFRWRTHTGLAWKRAGQPYWPDPARVTFTCYVGRLWDDDNLPAAVKTVRDTAVRLLLGTDDGPACGHVFTYKQEVRPKNERGVLIEVTPR